MKNFLIIVFTVAATFLLSTTQASANLLSIYGELRDQSGILWDVSQAINSATGPITLNTGLMENTGGPDYMRYYKYSSVQAISNADYGKLGVYVYADAGSVLVEAPDSYSYPWARANFSVSFGDAFKITDNVHSSGDSGTMRIFVDVDGYKTGDSWAKLYINNTEYSAGDMYYDLSFRYNEWTNFGAQLTAQATAYASEGSGMLSFADYEHTAKFGIYSIDGASGLDNYTILTNSGVDYKYTVTPEPASMVLFGLGGAAMAFRRLRRKTV